MSAWCGIVGDSVISGDELQAMGLAVVAEHCSDAIVK